MLCSRLREDGHVGLALGEPRGDVKRGKSPRLGLSRSLCGSSQPLLVSHCPENVSLSPPLLHSEVLGRKSQGKC